MPLLATRCVLQMAVGVTPGPAKGLRGKSLDTIRPSHPTPAVVPTSKLDRPRLFGVWTNHASDGQRTGGPHRHARHDTGDGAAARAVLLPPVLDPPFRRDGLDWESRGPGPQCSAQTCFDSDPDGLGKTRQQRRDSAAGGDVQNSVFSPNAARECH